MEKRIRVLQWGIANSGGGVTKYILQNFNYIDKTKYQFDFITQESDLAFCQNLIEQGCVIYKIPKAATKHPTEFMKSVNRVFETKYDIVHFHMSFLYNSYAFKVAKKSGAKIIVHSHTSSLEAANKMKQSIGTILHKRMRNKIVKYGDVFCACSTLAANWMFGNNIKRNEIVYLNNAIDANEFCFHEAKRIRLRSELHLKEDNLAIGCVGRFTYIKNHLFLIDVFKKIHDQNCDARLILVGDGELFEKIKAYSEALNLKDVVLFLGKRNDISDILQAMDVFVSPSLSEGLGLTLIEAQSAGLKCFASADVIPPAAKLCALLEFISLDFPPQEWAEKILAAVPYKRENMESVIAAAGYNQASEIKKLEQLYCRVLRG